MCFQIDRGCIWGGLARFKGGNTNINSFKVCRSVWIGRVCKTKIMLHLISLVLV